MSSLEASVAIIGAGPIGIELAVALKQASVDFIQLEAEAIGATIVWYPPEMQFHSSADRLALAGVPIPLSHQQKPSREEYLSYLRAVVEQFQLEIRTFERVDEVERLADGRFELRTTSLTGPHVYRVAKLVLATGAMHLPRLLGIPGEELPHVGHYLREPHLYYGKRLLIVGGKNSAVEAAIRCQRAGARVTIAYRMADFDPQVVKFWLLPEVRGMIRDGRVSFLPSTLPIAIRPGSVTLASTDAGGAAIDGMSSEVDADFVLLLTGYTQDTTLLRQIGVEFSGPLLEPVFDPETMETNVPGVFLAGTVVAGPSRRRGLVIVETCHHHIPKLVNMLTS